MSVFSLGFLIPREASPINVSNPVRVLLDQKIVDDIFNMVEEFSSLVAISHFWGFWPSLVDLHASISKYCDPILAHGVHIFLNAEGLFIVTFGSAKDRKTIMCDNSFSW